MPFDQPSSFKTSSLALRFDLSEREIQVLSWGTLGVLPFFLQWGLEGVLALTSLISWLLPGWTQQSLRQSSGRASLDIREQLKHTLYACPIFLWWAINGQLSKAFTIVPLAIALTACYIIAWYCPFHLCTENNRKRAVGLVWACFFALNL